MLILLCFPVDGPAVIQNHFEVGADVLLVTETAPNRTHPDHAATAKFIVGLPLYRGFKFPVPTHDWLRV